MPLRYHEHREPSGITVAIDNAFSLEAFQKAEPGNQPDAN